MNENPTQRAYIPTHMLVRHLQEVVQQKQQQVKCENIHGDKGVERIKNNYENYIYKLAKLGENF